MAISLLGASRQSALRHGSFGLRRGLHGSPSSWARSVLGIRAEDPKRIWERRTPLTPTHVQDLVQQDGIDVLIQPSAKRIFSDASYAQAGARITTDLSDASVILGIKEVPADDLLSPTSLVPERTYCFFSHTHKGQAYNRPLLKAMLDSKSSFVDWELLTDESGARTTAFGYLAGLAGAAEALSGLGIAALKRGVGTPFLNLPRPFVADTVKELDRHLEILRRKIETDGTPEALGPVTVGLTGRGRVGKGAKYVLDRLGAQWVKAAELKGLVKDPNTPRNAIYASQLHLEDYLVHHHGHAFSRSEYDSHPERFHSRFDELARYLTLFINGTFWSPTSPRTLSTRQLLGVLRDLKLEAPSSQRNRMLQITDVSCDFEGGLEFVSKATTICDPYLYIDPEHGSTSGPDSTQVVAIEILPSELARDASEQFSSSLLPYVRSLLKSQQTPKVTQHLDDAELSALARATICADGKLAEKHQWLEATLPGLRTPAEAMGRLEVHSPQKVLMLGSGMVAGPAADCLLRRPNVSLVVASNDRAESGALVEGNERARAVDLDISDGPRLRALVDEADVVISLLPAAMHVPVAEACISKGKHLVTASYTSPAMRQLHSAALSAGSTVLCELGLDPGIDHMLVMKLLAQVQAEGGEVQSFVSFCGGLPAPEDRGPPPGYKFSWSPMGVLTATQNDARFRLEGKDYEILGSQLLATPFTNVPLFVGFELEGLANRDSLAYISTYGLPSDLPTMLRGTLRYPGFAKAMSELRGLLDPKPFQGPRPTSWKDLFGQIAEAAEQRRRDGDYAADGLLRTLGLNRNSNSLPPFPANVDNPMGALASLLAHQLRYGEGERDLVLLHHELGLRRRDGREELLTSSLVEYGAPVGSSGHSAMAKTVGTPAALGALLLLDGGITERGVIGPTGASVWEPLLESLAANGLRFEEGRKDGRGISGLLKQQIDSRTLAR